MKLLILLVLLVAAAWLAPAPLSHVESAVEINASRDKVWSILEDVGDARLWDRESRDAKIISDIKVGLGTQRAAQGSVVKSVERVSEWVPYNRLGFTVTHDPALTKFETMRIDIAPSGASGTHVKWVIDYQMNGGYLGNLADRFLLGSAHQGRIDDGLMRLKRYAETGDVIP